MGIKLSWGDPIPYINASRLIVEQPNEFYVALAKGVEHAASLYGNKESALAFGKNEMPGYHTGPGTHVGNLIGLRHSHLDNAGYSIDQKVLSQKQISPEELADLLLEEERWRQILSTLVVCFFARGIYQPDIVSKLLPLVGFELNLEDLDRIGTDIYKKKFQFKTREGFSLNEIRVPKRIFEASSPVDQFDETYIRCALNHVKKILSKPDNNQASPA